MLFGRNVASYKFALAGALLELGEGRDDDVVTLDVLALPFALRVAAHLRSNDRQGTFRSSRFLDACRAHNRGDIDDDQLRSVTVQIGFNDVIDAFHIVDRDEIATRFFHDERSTSGGIRVTDELRKLAAGAATDLAEEVEARWRLVETAWELNVPRRLLTVDYQSTADAFVTPRRRTTITGVRGALNGYQKGHCFYCFDPIRIAAGEGVCHVDHVFPWSTGPAVGGAPIDGVWNLVLACARCNGWNEKSDRPPGVRYVERLARRNEYLVASHHPLRPTLITQTGPTTADRQALLRRAFDEVTVNGARTAWTSPFEGPAKF